MTNAPRRQATDNRRRRQNEPEQSWPARTTARPYWFAPVMGILFVATLVYAAFVLPDPVAVYFWPATQPDVMYPLWLYLLHQTVVGPIVGLGLVGLGRAAWALGEALLPKSKAGPDHGAAKTVSGVVFAWALAWITVDVWLAIGFDNKHDLTHSLCELALTTVAFLGTFAIVAVGLRRAHPRHVRQGWSSEP